MRRHKTAASLVIEHSRNIFKTIGISSSYRMAKQAISPTKLFYALYLHRRRAQQSITQQRAAWRRCEQRAMARRHLLMNSSANSHRDVTLISINGRNVDVNTARQKISR